MRKIIAFMHISLEGFVTGPNGEMNWIKIDQEIFDHVGKRISQGDTALYGRVTYQMMENYWPNAGKKPNATKHDIEHSKWYASVHKVVLSTTMKDIVANTTVISNNLADRLNEIKQQGDLPADPADKEILFFWQPYNNTFIDATGPDRRLLVICKPGDTRKGDSTLCRHQD